MELHYKATVDDEEWEVSSITVSQEWKLKDLKTAIISANEWDERSTVSFFRNESTKRVPLTTGVQKILEGNNEGNPLNLVVVQEVGKRPTQGPPIQQPKEQVRGELLLSNGYEHRL